MKYEIKLVYKTSSLSKVECRYRCVVPSNRYEFTKEHFETIASDMKKQQHVYDAWLLVNLLDDNGEFVEVVQ